MLNDSAGHVARSGRRSGFKRPGVNGQVERPSQPPLLPDKCSTRIVDRSRRVPPCAWDLGGADWGRGPRLPGRSQAGARFAVATAARDISAARATETDPWLVFQLSRSARDPAAHNPPCLLGVEMNRKPGRPPNLSLSSSQMSSMMLAHPAASRRCARTGHTRLRQIMVHVGWRCQPPARHPPPTSATRRRTATAAIMADPRPGQYLPSTP